MMEQSVASRRTAVKEPSVLVELRNVKKAFGSFVALHGIDLDLMGGEVLTLLGPSGCGKSTLLRILAGFDALSSGTIKLRGNDMVALPPEKRPLNMVFQRYALFPHLDVFDNIAFGLRLKKFSDDEIRSAVLKIIELVKLDGMADRWISELSGGQSQRVALARALVNSPEVLLLDEPLAALDLKIRQHMLVELKSIQEQTSTTFVYVTHDQDEAMLLSDRIALMDHGRIDQLGTPDDLYFRPESLFAAKFLGEANILDGTVIQSSSSEAVVSTPNVKVVGRTSSANLPKGTLVHVVLRPEAVEIVHSNDTASAEENRTDCVVTDILPIGSRVFYTLRLADGTEVRSQQLREVSRSGPSLGDNVTVVWKSDAAAVITR